MSAHLSVLEMVALLKSGAGLTRAKGQFQVSELSPYQQRQFNFILGVAQSSGGALASALERLAEVFDAQQRQLQELRVAFASPKATANLILLLPIGAVLFAELLGFGALSKTLGTSLGAVAIGAGLVLLIIARVLSLKMLERAKPTEIDPGAFLDAVVVGLSAGLSPKAAATLAQAQMLQAFSEPVASEQLSQFWDAATQAEQSGIALSGILSARADALRQKLWNRRRGQLSKLSVSLMLPLGLAALPAFVLLAVVPIGLGLFREV